MRPRDRGVQDGSQPDRLEGDEPAPGGGSPTDRAFRRGRKLDKVGQQAADTAEMFFDDVQVPATNLLGEEGKGMYALMQKLPRDALHDRGGRGRGLRGHPARRDPGLREGAACLRADGVGFPEHQVQAGRHEGAVHRGIADDRSLSGRAPAPSPDAGRGSDRQAVLHRVTGQRTGHDGPAARRLWLHAGVPGGARVRRLSGQPHLWRDQRGAARADRPQAVTQKQPCSPACTVKI